MDRASTVVTEVAALSRQGDPPLDPDQPRPYLNAEVGSCLDCEARADLTQVLLVRFPSLTRRLGPAGAERRIQCTLDALAVLGRPSPGTRVSAEQFGPQLFRLAAPGSTVQFAALLAPVQSVRPGTASREPWGHVSSSARAVLRSAWAELLRDRVAAAKPHVLLPPPAPVGAGSPVAGGCMWCGVRGLVKSAAEVSRMGGGAVARKALWEPIVADAGSLGGRSGQQLSGFLCPACSSAKAREGSVGVSALGRACESFLRSAGREVEADRVARGDARVVAWGAVLAGRRHVNGSGWGANEVPWAHGGEPVR